MAGEEFQHILRVLNTNVDGKQNVMYAITAIKGIGRRFANIVCKKAEVDIRKRCVPSPVPVLIWPGPRPRSRLGVQHRCWQALVVLAWRSPFRALSHGCVLCCGVLAASVGAPLMSSITVSCAFMRRARRICLTRTTP